MWDLGALFLHIWHGETSTANKSTLARSKGMLPRNIASGNRLRSSVRRMWHCLGSSRRFHHRAWSWQCLCGNGQRSKKKSSREGCSEVKIVGSSPVGPRGACRGAPGTGQSLLQPPEPAVEQGEVGGEGAAVRGSRVQAEGNPPHGQAQEKRTKSASCSCKVFFRRKFVSV